MGEVLILDIILEDQAFTNLDPVPAIIMVSLILFVFRKPMQWKLSNNSRDTIWVQFLQLKACKSVEIDAIHVCNGIEVAQQTKDYFATKSGKKCIFKKKGVFYLNENQPGFHMRLYDCT